MFTKKTRVVSTIVTVCMLITMMATFCLPVAAESNYDEVVPAKGLTDVSALTDIKGGLVTGVTSYKVTDRAGMDAIANLVAEKKNFAGYTITMANDIDMSGIPFAGIGAPSHNTVDNAANTANYTFNGTFDGNGFVFTNLNMYIGSTYGVGLFGNCSGATVKNVGIASGLIVGADRVGAIVGLSHNGTKLINCWNAATIVGGSSQGAAGLIGTVVDGKTTVTNCYNLGLVYNHRNSAAGLIGQVCGNGKGLTVNNSYSAGTLLDGYYNFSATSHEYFGAIMRPANVTIETSEASADNYYLNTIGKPGWEKGAAVAPAMNDGATAFAADELSSVHELLNNNIQSDSADYTVAYAYSEAGYPVLTYSKDDTVVAKRLPAADAQNVMGNDWAEKNTMFAKLTAGAHKGVNFSTVGLTSADDLFVFSLISAFNTANKYFGVSLVEFSNDIDMKDLTLANVDYYVSLGANSNIAYTIDGKGHTLSNWSAYTYHSAAQVNASGAFIHELVGGTLTNLSMENAYSAYDMVYPAVGTPGNTYPSLCVEMVNTSGTVTDVSTNGHIDIMKKGARNPNNDSGIVGRSWSDALTIRNCFSETTVTYVYENTNFVARAVGSHPVSAAITPAKYTNVFWLAPVGAEVAETEGGNPVAKDEIQLRITAEDFHCEETAVLLNESSDQALWTIKMIDGVKKVCRAADISETLAGFSVQRYIPTPLGYDSEPLAYGPPTTTYHMRGEEIALPNLPGYEVENGIELPFILNDNATVNYYMLEPDYSYLDEAQEVLASYEPAIFGGNSAEIFGNLKEALDTVYDATGNDEKIAAIYKVMLCCEEAKDFLQNGELNAAYPNLPPLSKYESFAPMGVTEWAIKSKEDWAYATNELDPVIATTLRLHLTNDVDMENTQVKPLAYGATFVGLIDGHGYTFKNFNLTFADPNGFTYAQAGTNISQNSFGLVAHLGNGGVIQNLGLASGKIQISNIGSQDQGVGGFAGVAEGSSKIINCWNGLSITASNKTTSSPSRVAGIVGRGYGYLYGCYNVGTVSGNSKYIHGLNAYAQNGNGKFYNCYNLPSSQTIGNHTAAIGQGGSYQTNGTASTACYVNTYSVGAYLIWGYKDMANPTVTELSESHTLTWDEYNSGYMAYTMNKDFVGISGADRVYWTINEDGRTVHGTADNAVRKVSLMLDGKLLSERYVNGDATFTISQPGYDVKNVVVEQGGAIVSGADQNVITMRGNDVVLSFSADCTHEGTVDYTYNNDGTHTWECTECNEKVENIPCSANEAWTSDGDDHHTADCICGNTIERDCYYNEVTVVNGQDYHNLTCTCGASKKVACTYAYRLVGENRHTVYCTGCDKSTVENCTMSDWELFKAATHDAAGEERKTCECGRYESREVAKLSGATIHATATGDAYAGEEIAFNLNLSHLPAAGVKSAKVRIYYDADLFSWVNNGLTFNGNLNNCLLSTNNGYAEITISNTAGLKVEDVFATFKLLAKDDVPDCKSAIKLEVVESDVTLGGSATVVDVHKRAWADVNGDHKTTISDLVLVLCYVQGNINVSINQSAADVWSATTGAPGKDNAITTADAILILRYLTGEYYIGL